LQTNEKGYFKTKHKALKIPQDFPNLEVLRYYTHPVVSPESNIEKARQKLEQKQELHLAALREFTRETFDWDYRIGAIKFIRVLGQALLVKHMIESKDTSHVKRISGRRTHFSTDGTPELRLAYIPEEVVPIDLAGEVDETVNYGRTGLALNSDDEYDGLGAIEDAPVASAPKVFDVTKPDLAWVLEGLVKKSAPGVLREWQVQEQARAVRRSPTKKKAGVAKAVKHPDMPRGSLDKFLTVTKTTVSNPRGSSKTVDPTLLKSPTRPKIRTNPSKQSSSSPTRSPRKSTAIQEIDSSPITPRFSRSQKQPETILISSSPLGPVSCTSPASTFPPGSSSHAAPTLSSSGTVPQSIRSILQATRSSESLDTSPRRNRHQRHVEPVPSGSGFKQPSITTFLDSSKSNGTEREATRKAVEVDSDSDLEPIYSLAKPGLSVKEIPQKQATRHNEEPAGTMGHPAPTKKLFRARASGSGFIEEVELSAEEREAELNSKSGKKSSMVRWSDVSIIDLTQPDS
jgi:Holliday junction resolvase YEN1